MTINMSSTSIGQGGNALIYSGVSIDDVTIICICLPDFGVCSFVSVDVVLILFGDNT